MSSNKPNYAPALIVLTSLFFTWGLITSLNDILVPHFKAIFTLNYVQAMLVQFCFFGAYFVASLPCGYIVERIGYRRGIIGGLLVAGVGCIGFYPAAQTPSYPLFLASLFVLACGITLLQVAANPTVAGLGDSDTSASRLNLTQAFNSLGTTIGPPLGAALILSETTSGATDRATEMQTVQAPYLALAGLLVLTAFVFSRFKLPELPSEARDAPGAATDNSHASLLHERHLVLGVGAIFLYVGAEVAIGSFLVNYLAQPSIAGLSESAAGHFLAFYWGGAMIGRFIGSAVLRKVPAGRVLAINAAGAIVLLVIGMTVQGRAAMWAVLAVGLCNSIMFPTIFTMAISGLGHRTGTGSGWLCMAIVGGALVPLLMGYFADTLGLTLSFIVPAVCYAYLVHYGLAGHVTREPNARTAAVSRSLSH